MNSASPYCNCFSSSRVSAIHFESQDTECEAWIRLLELIDRTAITGASDFDPAATLGLEGWRTIVTLPDSIARLKSVRRMNLYASNLDRIPPQIGEMESLEVFDPYTSYRLHWFPFEITRCKNLQDSRVSTRALYGNYKFRHPFPRIYDNFESLPGATPSECSICREPLECRIIRRWISLKVATDVLPLLVNACSEACIASLPSPPANYVSFPHSGGSHLQQPPAR